MLSPECVHELRTSWLPNMTDAGLDRLIDLMESEGYDRNGFAWMFGLIDKIWVVREQATKEKSNA